MSFYGFDFWTQCNFMSTPIIQKIKDEKSFGAEVYLHVSFESTLSWFLPDWFTSITLKFIYSEKTTKFCEIFTLLLTATT